MKSLILPLVFLTATQAYAAAVSLRSNLPDGKYSMQCENVSISRYDMPAANSDHHPSIRRDVDGLTREVATMDGTAIFVTTSKSVTEKDTYAYSSNVWSGSAEDVFVRTYTQVAPNMVEETETSTNASKVTGSESNSLLESATESYKTKSTIRVDGDFEIIVKSQNGDDPEREGHQEKLIRANGDGSFTILTYLREGFRVEPQTSPEGVTRSGVQVYQRTSTCTYIPKR